MITPTPVDLSESPDENMKVKPSTTYWVEAVRWVSERNMTCQSCSLIALTSCCCSPGVLMSSTFHCTAQRVAAYGSLDVDKLTDLRGTVGGKGDSTFW